MRRHYEVCSRCQSTWIWQDRLLKQPDLTCRQCGYPWQQKHLKDLKQNRRRTQWAAWNFQHQGAQWPKKSYQEALLEPPPGLCGGTKPKRGKKPKPTALQKAVQEHWSDLPAALKSQCEAMGLQAESPPAPPDLPTLIKEHLQSLPTDLKEAVEKLVEPTKPEPTLATKLKQSVGQLKQLAEKKAAIQQKADAVKSQYTALLQELKETQTKIDSAQQELQQKTQQYSQQLEKEKQEVAEEDETWTLAPEKLMTIFAQVGVQATADQVTSFARQIEEAAAKRRKCG